MVEHLPRLYFTLPSSEKKQQQKTKTNQNTNRNINSVVTLPELTLEASGIQGHPLLKNEFQVSQPRVQATLSKTTKQNKHIPKTMKEKTKSL